jgi:hypothetical protein
MKLEVRWAALAVLVVIGAWKTADFATAVAPESNNWSARILSGTLYFVVFMASEIWPHAVRPAIVRLTRAILLVLVIVVVIAQALASTYDVISDGMEYERLTDLRSKIEAFKDSQFRDLYAVYGRLLAESGCTGRSSKRSRSGTAACESLQRNREEVLNAPRTYRLDPIMTSALRELLETQLDQLEALRKKVPANRRTFEVYPMINLGIERYSYVAVIGWAVKNYNRLPAQVLFGQLARNTMVLVLALVAAFWCQQTSHVTR